MLIQGYTLLDFTDATGAGKQIYHVTETDTFTGPTGVSLTSVTYVYDLFRAIWDAQGNALRWSATAPPSAAPAQRFDVLRAGRIHSRTRTTTSSPCRAITAPVAAFANFWR